MGPNSSQYAGYSLRLRTVALILFSLLFGLQLAPLAQAQAAATHDCCMDGKGCSMHLHRAMEARQAGHTFAAFQAKCPCPPMAPSSAAAHGASGLPASQACFALAAERAFSGSSQSLLPAQAAGNHGTRGPPAVMIFA